MRPLSYDRCTRFRLSEFPWRRSKASWCWGEVGHQLLDYSLESPGQAGEGEWLMERMEVRIPRVLSMLPESEKGTFSKAIASSAKLRVAVLERRLREGRAMLRKFEDEWQDLPGFERDFPEC